MLWGPWSILSISFQIVIIFHETTMTSFKIKHRRDKCSRSCGGGFQKRGRVCNIRKPDQVSGCICKGSSMKYVKITLGTVLDGTYTFPSLTGVHNWPFRRLSILISLFVFQYYYFLKNIVAKSDLDLSIVVLRILLKQNTALLSHVRVLVR